MKVHIARKAPLFTPFYILLGVPVLMLAGCVHDPATKEEPAPSDSIAARAEIPPVDSALADSTQYMTVAVPEPVIPDPPSPGPPRPPWPPEYRPFEEPIYREPEPVTNIITVYTYADTMPAFPGGNERLNEFLSTHLRYPEYEKENEIEGRLYVRFVVGSDGKIREPHIVKSVKDSKSLDTEVLRVIGLMPDWTPGRINGENVDVEITLPVTFRLN